MVQQLTREGLARNLSLQALAVQQLQVMRNTLVT